MFIKRREIPVLVVNLAYLAIFGALSVARLNYEFVIYALVVAVAIGLVALAQRHIELPVPVLWGLTAWGLLHMAGGHLTVGDGRLYDVILLPVWPRYEVLKYDQAVHAFGFGVATAVCYYLLLPCLQPHAGRLRTGILVALMGVGLGALNEVVELFVVLTAPESGVGGYYNTAFDLAFNALGAAACATFLLVRCPPGRAGE